MKKITTIFTALLLLFQLSFLAQPAQAAEDFSVAAKAGFAVDAKSGKIFFDQNGEQALGIASVTKLVSSYVILDAIKAKKITWETEVPISKYAAELSVVPDLSNVPLHQKDHYTVRELFDATIIQSANAAVVALAEKVAGSEPKFVDLMRKKVNELGIKDAKLVNASGLTNSFLGDHRYPGTSENDENEMSARDVALLTQHLLKDHPEILTVSQTGSKEFGTQSSEPFLMENWNQLLPGKRLGKTGVDGLKTGTTDYAGACFVGTMEKDGQRVITVILNATNHKVDEGARFEETSKLMDYCYDNWQLQEHSLTGHVMNNLKKAPVTDGVNQTVPLALSGTVKFWGRTDLDNTKLTITPQVKKNLTAPLAKNTTVGKARVEVKDDPLGYLEPKEIATVKIKTSQAVEKANPLVRAWRSVTSFF
ncbi:serine hydrolase [Enterococcus sp. CSURQ0835]|uniref:serine hydrolase n=1 Tax=Enterococcus sp. CSURQ0835 TaxID=2681394 RepID=UPI001356EDF3|nr:serine hydrolase [Enterococcus sp. CSURQ0835]